MAKNLMQQIMLKPKKDSFDSEGLIAKIESGYIKDTEKVEFMRKRSFAPSTLVWGNGACARYWYIAFSGADFERDWTAKSMASMKAGSMGHERLQEAMKQSGVMAEMEVKLTHEDPPIFGFMDAMLDYKAEHLPAEIKTMKEESFQYRKAAGIGAPYHIEQLLIYMKILAKKRGVLIYESKNTHELMVILVEMNDTYKEWVEELFEWMRIVRKAWGERQLPQKTYRANSKICKGCPVRKTCAELPKGDIRIEPKRPLE